MRYRSRFKRNKVDKKEEKRLEAERIEKGKQNLTRLFEKASEFSQKANDFTIFKKGLADFFEEITLETNKIHIIRGNNGQGKSTLLKNIANSLFLGTLDNFENRLKISSNNKLIAKNFNRGLVCSPFEREDDAEFFPSGLDYNLATQTLFITMYIDFSVSFFRESSGNMLVDALENVNQYSNGERKIKAINDIFTYLKFILANVEIKNGLNILIIADEPETGLSLEIQKEFLKKVNFYLNKALKNEKLSFTFVFSSHSYIWQDNKTTINHEINSFKTIENKKKIHKKVFV